MSMDIKASEYNNLGGNWNDIGKSLITLIDYLNYSQELYVLDIGCGDGKLTAFIDKHLKGLLPLYGVDIDEKMIDFAKQNYSGSAGQNEIQYLVQDFGVQWNQLRPELKALEDRVSVIFSNMTLHWIYANKDNVAQNMSKFLSKNGKIYLNIYCIPNKNTESDVIFTTIYKQIPSIPTKEEQYKDWIDSFRNAGLDLVLDNFNLFDVLLSVELFDKVKNQIIWPISQQFLKSDQEKERVHELFKTVPAKFVQEFRDESTGQMMCKVRMQYFQFILEKK